ncbi:MAG: aromatic amino acid lyase, partial [Chitinophagaceae bacterium]
MIQVGGRSLSLSQFAEIVVNKQSIVLDPATLSNLALNHSFLRRFSDHKLIYGINTGFGPMAQFKVSAENALQLQY